MAVGALQGLVAVLGVFLGQGQPAPDRGPPKQNGLRAEHPAAPHHPH
jgi:hypothetical protein